MPVKPWQNWIIKSVSQYPITAYLWIVDFILYNWQGLSLNEARLGFFEMRRYARHKRLASYVFLWSGWLLCLSFVSCKMSWMHYYTSVELLLNFLNWTIQIAQNIQHKWNNCKDHLCLATARPCPIYANCPSHNHTLTHKNTHFKTLSPQPGPAPVRAIGMYRRLMKITSRAFISSNTTERRVCTQEIFDLN